MPAPRAWRRLAPAVAVVAALAAPAAASAAVGADDYNNPAVLLFSDPGTVADNVGYTVQGGEPVAADPSCNSLTMTRTAWWRFTGTGQPITLSTSASTLDTVLAVYDAPSGAPILGNRIACNDDAPGAGTSSALSFPSVRGKSYLIQVGANGPDHGKIGLLASAARPGNDDRIAAQTLQTGVFATVDNAGASQEPGETLTCATAALAATLWFTWTAPAVGDAVFTSSGAFGDTVLTVLRASDGAALACNAASTATVPLRVAAGAAYLIQVGTKGSDVAGLGTGPITVRTTLTLDLDIDRDGEPGSTDCNDLDPSIRHGIVDTPDDGVDQNCDGADAVNPDRDRDGESRPADCDDNNPAIHHGAVDVPGNAVDEDCSGTPAPFPRLGSSVRTSWRLNPFHITQLTILHPVAGSKVQLHCAGHGCPFTSKSITVKRTAATLSVATTKLTHAHPRRGAVLEIRITKPGFVGVLRRVTVRATTKDPKIQDFCTPAGGGTPRRC